MRWRWSKRAIGLLTLVVGLALAAAGPGKELLKSQPVFPQLMAWYFNLRAPQMSPSESGDGRPAPEILLRDLGGLAEDGNGNIYISDRSGFVWKVDPIGIAHVIAGIGRRGTAHTGIPALSSELGSPEGVAVDRRNRVYFADSFNSVVLRIEQDGKLMRIAGDGTAGYDGDGGPATSASLNRPFDIRFDSQANLYIVDVGNHRIRKVDVNGIIRTVAGVGMSGYSGDGGLATAARLNEPYGIYVDMHGNLYIADSGNHVIRKVDKNGVIDTLAGQGRAGYGGDQGPARKALLNSPQFLLIDESGSIYVGDEHNHVIRFISPDGTIATLIGGGEPGYGGDVVPLKQALLSDPEGLILRGDGSLLIADGNNACVRIVRSNGTIVKFAGRH